MSKSPRAKRIADRLVHWYPAAWRARYGEEFAAMLRAEIEDRPRSWQRAIDVRWHGAKARMRAARPDIGSLHTVDAFWTARAFAVACFLATATALWSQVLEGSSSAPTAHPSVVAVRVVMGTTAAVLCIRAVFGAIALARSTTNYARIHGVRRLAPWLLTTGVGVLVFAGGLITMWSSLRWGVTFASITRVITWSLNSVEWRYLSEQGHAQLVWMIASPLAVVVFIAGLTGLQRLMPATSRSTRWPWQASLLAPSLIVSVWYTVELWHHPMNAVLRASDHDLVLLAIMALSLLAVAAAEVGRDRRAEGEHQLAS